VIDHHYLMTNVEKGSCEVKEKKHNSIAYDGFLTVGCNSLSKEAQLDGSPQNDLAYADIRHYFAISQHFPETKVPLYL
jgi:hypothetical protein